MIVDELRNCEKYNLLDKNFKIGFDFLKNTDFKNIKDGRYELKGNEVFANVQSLKTKQKELKKWEVHRKYIDIQYVISGMECMGQGFLKDFNSVVVPYDSNKDVEFLDGNKFSYINVNEGDFVIFYPNDVHAPMLSVENDVDIRKVIVKIAI